MSSFTQQAADWEEGSTLGRYTILSKLGEGGMAEIYLARQAGPRGFERLCALKVMKDLLEGDSANFDMFLDEARIAAQLSHPNIVQIYDFGEERGLLYLAMEYLAGETLGKVLKIGGEGTDRFPLAYSVRTCALAAGALHYAHISKDLAGRALNLVHRDVSPDNLFLTYAGELKVLDFGIAKAAHRQAQTAVGMVKGKISYLSPEAVEGRELDGRADVFALGLVLYEALTGSHPFQKKAGPMMEFLMGKAEAPRVRERNPLVPQELEEIVAGAIERDRESRIHSALELQRMLESWLKTQDAPDTAALSRWMHDHFEQRISDRMALVERAAQVQSMPKLPAAPPAPEPPKVVVQLLPPEPTPATVSVTEPAPLSPVAPPAPEVHDDVAQAFPSRTRSLAVGAGLGLVILLAVGGYVASTRHPEAPVVTQAPEPAPTPAPAPAPVPAPAPAPAPPTTVHFAVATVPAAAQVRLDGEDKGAAPLELDGLAPGPHQVEVSLAGYQSTTREVQAKPGEAVHLEIALAPEAPVRSPRRSREAPEPSGPPGKLTLDTSPWTTVYLGKKALGETPLVGVEVPSGTLHLKLVNPEARLKETIEVVIEPGKTTAKRLQLRR